MGPEPVVLGVDWLRGLHLRRRVHYLPDDEAPTVRQAILKCQFSQQEQRAALKDVHLVEAALATDCCIISIDGNARQLFERVAQQFGMLTQIVWADPSDDAEQVTGWLADGAYLERWRCLGSRKTG